MNKYETRPPPPPRRRLASGNNVTPRRPGGLEIALGAGCLASSIVIGPSVDTIVYVKEGGSDRFPGNSSAFSSIEIFIFESSSLGYRFSSLDFRFSCLEY